MIGSFLTRGLVMVFGYAYPAYECYKTVEKNKPEIEQLRFWCQYWILVALLTFFERVGDAFVSWVPMYSEAKLAFFIYLWYPKTKGTTYVYNSFFKPYLSKHENEIDRNLLELRTRAGDMAVIYCRRAASYGQTRIFEILQFVGAQSTPKPQPPQKQQPQKQKEAPKGRRGPNAPKFQPSSKPQPESKEPPPSSPKVSSSSSQQQNKPTEEKSGPSQIKPTPPSSPSPTLTRAISAPEKPIEPAPTEAEQIETKPPESGKEIKVQPKESIMEETIRITRGRLRKTRSAGTR